MVIIKRTYFTNFECVAIVHQRIIVRLKVNPPLSDSAMELSFSAQNRILWLSLLLLYHKHLSVKRKCKRKQTFTIFLCFYLHLFPCNAKEIGKELSFGGHCGSGYTVSKLSLIRRSLGCSKSYKIILQRTFSRLIRV